MQYKIDTPYLVFSEHLGLVVCTLVKWTDYHNYMTMEYLLDDDLHFEHYFTQAKILKALGESDVVGEL